MIVMVERLDRSDRMFVNGVDRIEENDALEIVLITEHSEPIVVDHHTHRIDVVGLG